MLLMNYCSQYRLTAGPGWELPSHQGLVPSRPGPGLAWDRELPSHRDLVPSHPMKKNLVPSRSRGTPGWDQDGTGHPVPCQEMLLFYNIYINIRTIQLMNSSFYSFQ